MQRHPNRRTAIHVIGPSIAYVPLTRGYFSIINAEDSVLTDECTWKLFDGTKRNDGFRAYTSTPPQFLSRMLLGAPKGLVVDHINRNTLDNRRENLRAVPVAINAGNRVRGEMCGIRRLESGRWHATFHANGRYAIGTFDTLQEAQEARRAAVAKHLRENGYEASL